MFQPSRRRLVAIGLAASFVGVGALAKSVAATSPAPPDTATAADPGALLPPAEGNVTYPLTLTTELGEVTIAERPERIVIPSSWDSDILAALGVTPAGTDEQIKFYPWVTERLVADGYQVWPVGDIAFPPEAIAAADPDLIVISTPGEVANLEQLESIAPVLGAPVIEGDATWRDRILLIGEALDLRDTAQQVVDDYDAWFADARASYPQFEGKTIAHIGFWGGEWGAGFINAPGSDAETFYSQLGFATTPDADVIGEDGELSEEFLGQIESDVIVIVDQSGSATDYERFISNPLLQGTSAATSGNLIELEYDFDGGVYYDGEQLDFTGHFGRTFNLGPLGNLAAGEVLVPILAERLD